MTVFVDVNTSKQVGDPTTSKSSPRLTRRRHGSRKTIPWPLNMRSLSEQANLGTYYCLRAISNANLASVTGPSASRTSMIICWP